MIATHSGIGPDGRAYVKGSSLDHYARGNAEAVKWLDAVVKSGGATDDGIEAGRASSPWPPGLATPAPASATMARRGTLEGSA